MKKGYQRLKEQAASVRPKDVLKYQPMSWTLRGAAFLLYATFAVLFLVVFLHDNQCHVRHTYRSELASSVLSNPMYTSNQVWRNPPRSKVEIDMMGYAYDQQRVGDIGVFPTVMSDVQNDAAFLPVVYVPGAGVAAEFANTTKEYMAIDGLRSMFLEGKTVPGTVSTEVLVNASMEMFDDTFVGLAAHGGLLPNFARCVKITTTNKDDGPTFYRELKKFVDHSFYRGSCALTGLQQKVDIQANPRTSLAPFSSISLFFIPHVIFWIAASFQLSYLFYPNGFYTTIAFSIATVWNFGGMAVAGVIGAQAGMNVPANNVMIAVFAYAAAIVVQWNWDSDFIMASKAALVKRGKAFVVDYSKRSGKKNEDVENARAGKGVSRNEARRRDAGPPKGPPPLPPQAERHRRINGGDQGGGPSDPTGAFLALDFGRHYEDVEGMNESRTTLSEILTFESMEHLLTVPMIITYLTAAYSAQVVPTGTLQLLFVMIVVTRLLCGALFRIQQVRVVDSSVNQSIFECVFGIYVMILTLAGTYTYIVQSFYAPAHGAIIGVLVLEWVYILSVGAVTFYEFVDAFAQEYVLQWALVPAFFDLVLKVLAMAYMWEAAKNKALPNHACSMWAHLQGNVGMGLLELLNTQLAELIEAAA